MLADFHLIEIVLKEMHSPAFCRQLQDGGAAALDQVWSSRNALEANG